MQFIALGAVSYVRIFMYFLYADGSGQTKIKRDGSSNGLYVLSGIMVHEKDWKSIECGLAEIKKEVFPHISNEWELHAAEIWNNRGRFVDHVSKIDYDKKHQIFSKVVNLIHASELQIINIIIHKDALNQKYVVPELMESSWTFLVERFEHALKNQLKETNNGLLFIDSDHRRYEKEIERTVSKLVKRGSLMQKIDHVIEYPIFVDSQSRNLIQLADLVAYVVHRHYKIDPTFEGWFDALKTKMYQPNGNLGAYGLKEFPI